MQRFGVGKSVVTIPPHFFGNVCGCKRTKIIGTTNYMVDFF